MIFTINQIEEAWKRYCNMQVLRVLKNGQWRIKILNGQGIPRVDATRAEVKTMRDVYDFPEYLRKFENKK